MRRRLQRLSIPLVCLLVLSLEACAGKRAPILVGQAGLVIAEAIGQIGPVLVELENSSLLSKPAALHAHQVVKAANDQLKPLPDLLDAINAAQQAGQEASASDLDQALLILTAVSGQLGQVLLGVPVEEATASLVKLVEAAQATVSQVLIAVARIQGALQ